MSMTSRSRRTSTARTSVRSPSRRAYASLTYTLVVQLHNALLVSLFDTSAHLAPPTPPPDVPKPPTRKRRRTLPYQGPDPNEMTTLRSERLKKWTVGLGRRERERIRALETVAMNETPYPRPYTDEIAAERGVQLLPERGGTSPSILPGSNPGAHCRVSWWAAATKPRVYDSRSDVAAYYGTHKPDLCATQPDFTLKGSCVVVNASVRGT